MLKELLKRYRHFVEIREDEKKSEGFKKYLEGRISHDVGIELFKYLNENPDKVIIFKLSQETVDNFKRQYLHEPLETIVTEFKMFEFDEERCFRDIRNLLVMNGGNSSVNYSALKVVDYIKKFIAIEKEEVKNEAREFNGCIQQDGQRRVLKTDK
jgi:hypothetical protein